MYYDDHNDEFLSSRIGSYDIKNPLKILYLDDDRDKDKYELFYLS